jgi:hypothetical protein
MDPTCTNGSGHLYLCYTNDHRKESIYKIGRTQYPVKDRLAATDYRSLGGAILIASGYVTNVKLAEKSLIIKFKAAFGNPIFGNEYFRGDLEIMKSIFHTFVTDHSPTSNNSTLNNINMTDAMIAQIKAACHISAKSGNLEQLEQSINTGYVYDEQLYMLAASSGHTHILKFLRDHGHLWNEKVCTQAAKHGHLDTLIWLHDNGCPWDDSIYTSALHEPEIIDYAKANKCPIYAQTYRSIAIIISKSGDLEMLKRISPISKFWRQFYHIMESKYDIIRDWVFGEESFTIEAYKTSIAKDITDGLYNPHE